MKRKVIETTEQENDNCTFHNHLNGLLLINRYFTLASRFGVIRKRPFYWSANQVVNNQTTCLSLNSVTRAIACSKPGPRSAIDYSCAAKDSRIRVATLAVRSLSSSVSRVFNLGNAPRRCCCEYGCHSHDPMQNRT